MCGGKAGVGQDAQGKASFVKDEEGELILFRHMNRAGQILHLPYGPSGPAQGGEQNLAPHPPLVSEFGYMHKSWEQFSVISGIRASPVPLWSTDTLAGQQ